MNSVRYIFTLLGYLKNSQKSRDEILQFQEQEWRKLVRYAQKKSPYYARIIREQSMDIQTCRPEDFPVLTKQIIQDHFNEIVTDRKIKQREVHDHVLQKDPDELYLGKYYVLKTSGSSGKPGYFLFNAQEMISGIAVSVARAPVGIRRSNKRITMLGFPKSYAGSSQTMRFGNNLWIAKKLLNYQGISIEQAFPEVVRQMNEFQPHVVTGYSKLLLLLADAQRKGELNIHPDSLQSGGEQLLDADRKYLREVFQCPVHNHYGSTEGFSMGICRDGEDSMELFEDHLHFRLGTEESYITNLQSRTMPLINYQIRDVLIPRPLNEAKPFFRVEPVIGRSDEIPYFTTEDNGKVTVHPLAFDPIMPEGVKSFFMSCDRPNYVNFHLMLDEKYLAQKEKIMNQARGALKEFFAAKNLPQVNFEVLHEIIYGTNAATGKTQFWRSTLLPKT